MLKKPRIYTTNQAEVTVAALFESLANSPSTISFDDITEVTERVFGKRKAKKLLEKYLPNKNV